MAQLFNKVYITASGAFFTGDPVDNDQIDNYVAPLNAASSRIKRRVQSENGIQQRYYSVNPQGETRYSCTHMAAEAARACLHNAGLDLSAIDMLCTGTSGGDMAMPGFANMLQGELGAPPWLTASHQGVCAAGISALSHAALSIEL